MSVKERIPLLNGEFELCLFTHRKGYHFRYYSKNAHPNKRRGYIVRSLKTEDRDTAEKRAFEEWRKLKTLEVQGGCVSAKSIPDVMKDWLNECEKRVETGLILQNTLNAKKSFFNNSLKWYFDAKGLKRVSQLEVDSFDDYRYWRLTEGWKYFKRSTNARKPPTDGTINSEIGLINEWYNNYLLPKRYVTQKPKIELKVLDLDDLSANPPIPQEEWRKIYNYLDKWSKPDAKGVNRPEVWYWRMCFRHYLLVAYNCGCRPTELVGRVDKRKGVIDRGLRWEDIDEEPQSHWSETQQKEVIDDPIIVLDIKKTKTKVPREVPCRTWKFLTRWRDFCIEYRKERGLPDLLLSDLVFGNPKTGEPYSYSMYGLSWKNIRQELQENFSDHYTVYSTRSSYVTNQLEEGVSTDDICKLTGHSYRVMRRHYDRLQMRSRIPQVTKRTFGKKFKSIGSKKLL